MNGSLYAGDCVAEIDGVMVCRGPGTSLLVHRPTSAVCDEWATHRFGACPSRRLCLSSSRKVEQSCEQPVTPPRPPLISDISVLGLLLFGASHSLAAENAQISTSAPA